MHCRRCQSTLVPVRKDSGSSSEQVLFRCTTCGRETMQTKPVSSIANAIASSATADEYFADDHTVSTGAADRSLQFDRVDITQV